MERFAYDNDDNVDNEKLCYAYVLRLTFNLIVSLHQHETRNYFFGISYFLYTVIKSLKAITIRIYTKNKSIQG